jgi:uncharacterized protein YeaO (DUF488 family)
MAIHIVQLGSPRGRGEGLRLGTVRRPPRGVPRHEYAARNFYDLWLPELAPSEALLKAGLSAREGHDDARAWQRFERRYRAEMKKLPASRLLDLLAALSHQTDVALGCYCSDESRCHRSILRALLRDRRAELAS